jgi:hypothetical protein
MGANNDRCSLPRRANRPFVGGHCHFLPGSFPRSIGGRGGGMVVLCGKGASLRLPCGQACSHGPHREGMPWGAGRCSCAMRGQKEWVVRPSRSIHEPKGPMRCDPAGGNGVYISFRGPTARYIPTHGAAMGWYVVRPSAFLAFGPDMCTNGSLPEGRSVVEAFLNPRDRRACLKGTHGRMPGRGYLWPLQGPFP